jgi:hypothetical protein
MLYSEIIAVSSQIHTKHNYTYWRKLSGNFGVQVFGENI